MSKRDSIPIQPRLTPRPEPNVGTLLLLAYRRFNRDLFSALSAAGHPALRPKHGAVMANLDAGGSRASELARRARMTKPAMGELVDELEELGYVRRTSDPRDRRAKLVVPTTRGEDAIRAGTEMLDRIEARMERELGKALYRHMRQALAELCAGEA